MTRKLFKFFIIFVICWSNWNCPLQLTVAWITLNAAGGVTWPPALVFLNGAFVCVWAIVQRWRQLFFYRASRKLFPPVVQPHVAELSKPQITFILIVKKILTIFEIKVSYKTYFWKIIGLISEFFFYKKFFSMMN